MTPCQKLLIVLQVKQVYEVGCKDDTVPKTVDTRGHCKVDLRVCKNLPQPNPYIRGL